jgi:hypothetical protein
MIEKTKRSLSALNNLIGSENADIVKKRIGDLLVDRVRQDLDCHGEYLFYPPDYEDSISEAFEKIKKKIIKMYSDAMLEAAQESVQRFKDVALSNLNDTQGLVLRNCHKCKYKRFNECKFYKADYWKAHDKLCAQEGFINYEEEKGE